MQSSAFIFFKMTMTFPIDIIDDGIGENDDEDDE